MLRTEIEARVIAQDAPSESVTDSLAYCLTDECSRQAGGMEGWTRQREGTETQRHRDTENKGTDRKRRDHLGNGDRPRTVPPSHLDPAQFPTDTNACSLRLTGRQHLHTRRGRISREAQRMSMRIDLEVLSSFDFIITTSRSI